MKYLNFLNAKKALLKQLKLILDNYSIFDSMQIEFLVSASVGRLVRHPDYIKDVDCEKISKLIEDLSYFQPDPILRKESSLLYGDKELHSLLLSFYKELVIEYKLPLK